LKPVEKSKRKVAEKKICMFLIPFFLLPNLQMSPFIPAAICELYLNPEPGMSVPLWPNFMPKSCLMPFSSGHLPFYSFLEIKCLFSSPNSFFSHLKSKAL
jgi:hypothetical protein